MLGCIAFNPTYSATLANKFIYKGKGVEWSNFIV
jgi:hypothetical protein